MKLSSALVAVSAVAAFAINVTHAAPLPPAHIQSSVVGSDGEDKLQARTFTVSDLVRLEDVFKEADQRLSEAMLSSSSAGPSHTAGASVEVHRPRVMGRVFKIWQVDPNLLRHSHFHSRFSSWEDFQQHWQAHVNNAGARGVLLPRPPEPLIDETVYEYANRLYRDHSIAVENLRRQRQK